MSPYRDLSLDYSFLPPTWLHTLCARKFVVFCVDHGLNMSGAPLGPVELYGPFSRRWTARLLTALLRWGEHTAWMAEIGENGLPITFE